MKSAWPLTLAAAAAAQPLPGHRVLTADALVVLVAYVDSAGRSRGTAGAAPEFGTSGPARCSTARTRWNRRDAGGSSSPPAGPRGWAREVAWRK
jgi:hypothetical protein